MAPGRLYTLPQLVKITGRPYDFWDSEAKSGRLQVLQPTGPNGTRYVAESAYDAWFEASLLGARPEPNHPPTYSSRRRELATFRP
jgi:hypothetical protein